MARPNSRWKFGEDRLARQLDLGWREIGGFFYPDSNIAQPMYPNYHGIGPSIQPEPDAIVDRYGADVDKRMGPNNNARDDMGKDDRGMERE